MTVKSDTDSSGATEPLSLVAENNRSSQSDTQGESSASLPRSVTGPRSDESNDPHNAESYGRRHIESSNYDGIQSAPHTTDKEFISRSSVATCAASGGKSTSKSVFTLSLDPIFLVVGAVACTGIIASLIALYVHSDRNIKQQLKALEVETAALSMRVAASQSTSSASVVSNVHSAEPVVVNDSVSTNAADDPGSQVPVRTKRLVTLNTVSEAANLQAQNVTVAPQAVVTAQSSASDPISTSKTISAIESSSDNSYSENSDLFEQITKLKATVEKQSEQITLLSQENHDLRLSIALNPDASGYERSSSDPNISSRASVLTDDSRTDSFVLTDESQQTDKLLSGETEIDTSKDSVSQVINLTTVESSGLRDTDTTQLPASRSFASPSFASGEVAGGEAASGELATLISEGYRAYQRGDYARARSVYERAMHLDPYSRDANLGVAAIAGLQGNKRLAEDRYRHLLSLNPDDLAAFSSMLELSLSNNSLEQEMRAHAEQSTDDSVVLYAALGNFYGQQSRWREAREAYSQTIAGNSARPDDIYNLAVSLDNLGRQQEALQYYLRAIDAEGDYSFNRVEVLSRLSTLQSDQ